VTYVKPGRGSGFIFLVNRNRAIEKRSKRKGEYISNFFFNIEFELFK